VLHSCITASSELIVAVTFMAVTFFVLYLNVCKLDLVFETQATIMFAIIATLTTQSAS
jgi:hypothetical protein